MTIDTHRCPSATGTVGQVRRILIGVLAALIAAMTPGGVAVAEAANVTVDLTSAVRSVPADAFGVDITGYGYHHYITDDDDERAMLTGRYGVLRIGLKYATPGDPTSPIVANGDGADTTVTGDEWIAAIRSLGAEPAVIVPADPTDAANMVRHFNSGGPNPVRRWIIGNEPENNGGDITAHSYAFNATADAMRAVDPTVSLAGPALGHLDDTNLAQLDTFLSISGSRVDVVDFHKYGAGATAVCDSDLLANTSDWASRVAWVRGEIERLVPDRASHIGIEVGEINSDWGIHENPAGCDNIGTEPVQYRNAAIWWSASVWGHLLDAGAAGFAYGDKNGALSLLYDQPSDERPAYAQNGAGLDERMPIYQGLGFFTGQAGTALAHFGDTLVASATTLPGVEVYASADPGVIVLVNKSTATQHATIAVTGAVSAATGYQKDGTTVSYATPADLGALPVSEGTIEVTLPGPSVTQIVLA